VVRLDTADVCPATVRLVRLRSNEDQRLRQACSPAPLAAFHCGHRRGSRKPGGGDAGNPACASRPVVFRWRCCTKKLDLRVSVARSHVGGSGRSLIWPKVARRLLVRNRLSRVEPGVNKDRTRSRLQSGVVAVAWVAVMRLSRGPTRREHRSVPPGSGRSHKPSPSVVTPLTMMRNLAMTTTPVVVTHSNRPSQRNSKGVLTDGFHSGQV